MKRDKYDTIVSDLVRERSDWTCEECGLQCHHDRGYLHCSHFKGRIVMSVRYDLDNCQSHCASCHKKFTENPDLHTFHFVVKRGEAMRETLTQRARQLKKWERPSKKTGYKGEKHEMYKHYQAELKRLLKL